MPGNKKPLETRGKGDAISAIIASQGSGYIRFKGGTQICWGEISWSQDGTVGSISTPTANFPKEFDSSPITLGWMVGYAGAAIILTREEVSSSQLQFYAQTQIAFTTGTTKANYIAIGTWS